MCLQAPDTIISIMVTNTKYKQQNIRGHSKLILFQKLNKIKHQYL
jgi:hypothetical protein